MEIGVIGQNQAAKAHLHKHIPAGYRAEWEIEASSVEDPERVKRPAQTSDHFVVTPTSADEVSALTGRTLHVSVNFPITDQSVAFLNQRIHQIRRAKMARLRSTPAAVPAAPA